MPLKSSKNNRDIQSIHSAPKMRSTGLEMAKNQGLDSVYQNKKNKNKKFREKAAEGHVGVYGDAPMLKRCPFSAFLSVTNMSVFMTYRGKADRRADRHHQRPPTGQPLATPGDTADTGDRYHQHKWYGRHWRRLAAVPVTTNKEHQPRTSTSGKASKAPAARTGRKGIII